MAAGERTDIAEDVAEEIDPFTGEYRSLALGVPSWGALSLLAAAPGLLFPWILPALIMNVGWSAGMKRSLLAIPISAAFGAFFALVELRQRGRSLVALAGLIVNLGLVAAALALVVRFVLR